MICIMDLNDQGVESFSSQGSGKISNRYNFKRCFNFYSQCDKEYSQCFDDKVEKNFNFKN